MNPFANSEDHFDPAETFVPEHIPEPGPFLEGHDVLAGEDHVEAHAIARELFEERGVYDVTFGYNLAKLNRDRRHPEAGFRYARDVDEPGVLRAEFTPTTEFCPQADVLTKGAVRAWNGLADRHEYDRVEVRVHPMHHNADALQDVLRAEAESPGNGADTQSADDGIPLETVSESDESNAPF